jgi:hypothetical protein
MSQSIGAMVTQYHWLVYSATLVLQEPSDVCTFAATSAYNVVSPAGRRAGIGNTGKSQEGTL